MDAFPPQFQQDVLAHIVYSTDFCRDVCERVKPDHFSNREQWIICTLAYEFYEKYEKAPQKNLRQEIAKYVRRTRVSEDAAGLLSQAYDALEKPRGNAQYLLDEIDNFLKHQSIRVVLEEFIPKYHRGEYDLDQFTKEISSIQSKYTQEDESIDVLQNASARVVDRLVRKRVRPVATLIDPLDEKIVGIAPQQLGTIIAPSGIGKSFMLTHFGKAAVLQGETVFHYTGEMSEEEVIGRYDQMMVGTNTDGLRLPGTSKKLLQATKNLRRQGGRLYVSFFPYPSTVGELRRDISRKIAAHGKPGLIISDYGSLLSPSGKLKSNEKHLELGAVWRELRSIAVDFNVPHWTAHQATRSAVGAKRVSELHSADSYEIIRISDIALGFNRNMVYSQRTGLWQEIDAEYNPDVVRVFVIKNRGRSDKHDVRFACDLDHSQFYSKAATEKMLREVSKQPHGKKKQAYIGDSAVLDD
jgi:replicative DNA helicase